MTHTLPSLAYSVDALEPHVDARTMEIHHGKHHQTYIDKLNGALENHSELNSNSVENLRFQIFRGFRKIFEVRFVTTEEGIHNHTFFWQCISPNGGGIPSGELARP